MKIETLQDYFDRTMPEDVIRRKSMFVTVIWKDGQFLAEISDIRRKIDWQLTMDFDGIWFHQGELYKVMIKDDEWHLTIILEDGIWQAVLRRLEDVNEWRYPHGHRAIYALGARIDASVREGIQEALGRLRDDKISWTGIDKPADEALPNAGVVVYLPTGRMVANIDGEAHYFGPPKGQTEKTATVRPFIDLALPKIQEAFDSRPYLS